MTTITNIEEIAENILNLDVEIPALEVAPVNYGGSTATLPAENEESRKAAKEEALRVKLGLKAMRDNLEKKEKAQKASKPKKATGNPNKKNTGKPKKEKAEKKAEKPTWKIVTIEEDGSEVILYEAITAANLLLETGHIKDTGKSLKDLAIRHGKPVKMTYSKSGTEYVRKP